MLDRGAACAGLWLLLRGVLGSGLVLALRSTEHSGPLASEDSFHAFRSAAAGSICSKSMAVGLCYLKCEHLGIQHGCDAKNSKSASR